MKKELLARWQADETATRAVARVSLTSGAAIALPGTRLARHSAVVCRCACGRAKCLRVVKADTLRRGWAGPRCPAHEPRCSTYSAHVAAFARTLDACGLHSYVVWDWHDVPGEQRRHFDATVLACNIAVRFEIDGRGHFRALGTQRLQSDERKDTALALANVAVTRLHVADQDRWNECVAYALRAALDCVAPRLSYSPAYADCVMDQGLREGIL